MAFLDNTGLARLWEHIVARFANREDVAIIRDSVNVLDNSNFSRAVKRREDFARAGDIIIGYNGNGTTGSGGGASNSATVNTKYIIDRWRTSSNVVYEPGVGLVMQQNATSYLRQGIENGTFLNDVYTVVITLHDDTKHGGIIDLTSSDTGSYTDNIFSIVLTRNYNGTYDKIDVTVNNTGGTFAIRNIGLYKGTFTSLPNYVRKTFQEEQFRAAYFFKAYRGSSLAGRCTSAALQARIMFENDIRTNQYDVLVLEKGTVYSNNKTPNGVAVTSIEPNSRGTNGVLLTVSTGSNTLTSNESGVWHNGSVGFDADYA